MPSGVNPTLSSPVVPSAGTTLTATLSDLCYPNTGVAGFTLTGTAATVASWAITRLASTSTLTLTLSGKVLSGETVKLYYDGIGDPLAGGIYNATDDALLALSARSVTNSSTQSSTDPISEQIVQHVVSTLNVVTAGATYKNTLTVEREQDHGNVPAENKCVVMVGDLITSDDSPLGLEEFRLPIGITIYDCSADTNTQAVSSRLASKAADVRKALLGDRSRGNRAVNTDFEPDKYFVGTDPRSVLVTTIITFRTLRGDPYNR